MSSAALRLLPVALVLAMTGSGCMSFWRAGEAGNRGPWRYTSDWYALESMKPVGARQAYRHGKLWPPFPRPAGKKQQLSQRFHSAHYWPHPYVCQDREYVHTVSQNQINNGWMAETTLYDYHFEEETNELTDSGNLKLRWILQNAPQQHRLAWVQTAFNAETNQARLATVRTATVELVGEANVPPIMLRIATPLGRPALEVDAIRRREIGSMPDPRVQYTPLPVGAGGGG